MYPEDLRYTRTHEWCRFEEDGTMVIGITDQFLKDLGEVVCAELPEVGEDVLNDVSFGELETKERIAPAFPPSDGEVVAVNGRILDRPELLKDSPYEEGWLIKIRPSEPLPAERLLSAEEYAAYVAES